MSNFRMIRPYQHYAKCALLIGAALISIAPAGRNSAVATTTAPQTNEFGPAAKWVSNFGYDAGGWRVEQHPRMMADVNGDGKQDVVGFSSDGVVVSLSIGSSFTETQLWVGEFGYTAGGWRVDKNPRMMADVNGDGKQDVVGFSNDAVWVALSTGSGFGTAQPWVDGFGYDTGGWRIDKHPRMMADVNGDHKQDVVGFSSDGVLVSLSTGSSFTKTQL